MRQKISNVKVIDLFCGIGGLSYGFTKVGFDVIAGIDIDETCRYAYEFNNNATFYNWSITDVTGKDLDRLFKKSKIRVLAGCAPCQPFSSYAFKVKDKDEGKYGLLYSFGRLIQDTTPEIVTMENVQQILNFKEPVLFDFVETLKKCGYSVCVNKVYCPDYGIPQTRKRLVLLASKFGEISLIPPTHTKKNYVTVREAIGHLPPIKAGETCSTDPLHVARALGSLNMRRMLATPINGSWRDWPEELWLDCHRKSTGKSFGSVYGRMSWDEPSPTMTTLCTGIGNGRFGHPDQNRAISVREAALFQTFPDDYSFFSEENFFSVTKVSRYIGNAVPPKLGEVIAESIKKHLEYHGKV